MAYARTGYIDAHLLSMYRYIDTHLLLMEGVAAGFRGFAGFARLDV